MRWVLPSGTVPGPEEALEWQSRLLLLLLPGGMSGRAEGQMAAPPSFRPPDTSLGSPASLTSLLSRAPPPSDCELSRSRTRPDSVWSPVPCVEAKREDDWGWFPRLRILLL